MAIVLRSASFIGEHGILTIRECGDRSVVQLLMQDTSVGADRHLIELTATEWAELTNLPYLNRPDCERREQPPNGVLETLTFIEDRTTLTIEEMPTGDSIRFRMNYGEMPEQDEPFIDLTLEQWEYLGGLDYVCVTAPSAKPAQLCLPSDSGVH
jgi:hypothetical protein